MSKKNIAEFYEKTILSSFIAEPWTFAEHRHRLKSNHFLNFGFLIDTLDQLYGAEKPFDVEVIESKTSSRDIQALYDIVTTPAVANVLHYIDELKEYRRKGELLEVARTLATDDGSSSEQILFKLEELLEQKDVTLEARHKNFDEWAEHYKDMPPLPRYPTGVSFLDFLLSGGVEMGQLMLISGAAEAGKAQPLYSKVLTPDGFITFRDIQVGQQVIGSDSKAHSVLGVYDRGIKDVYCITFNDGSKVECCDEHLWTVTKCIAHRFKKMTIELKEIMKDYLLNRYYVDAITIHRNSFKRWITHIEYVGKEPVRCIKVDAEDSLYVTDGYILTHNTSMGIQILKNVSKVAPVVFFSFEFTVRHFVEAQKFIEPKYKNSNMTIINEGMDLESLSANIRLHAKNGVRFFLIDSQMRVEVEKARNSEEEESKKFSTMAKLAHKYDLFILFIIQTSKTDPNSPIGSKKGSHESSITIHIEHVPVPKGDEENSKNPWVPTKRIVEVKKNKQTGKHYKEEVAFNPQNREFFMIHESHKKHVPVEVIYDEKPMQMPRL